METQSQTQKCAVCEEVSTKSCSICRRVYYCCRDHQKQHWPQHKTHCKPFKVALDSILGRHLVATRDIKVGEVVLHEQPLLRGPCRGTPARCLSCLKWITSSNSAPCEKCGWPLCLRDSCRQSEEHRPECEWASLRKVPLEIEDFINPCPEYNIVTILRLCYVRLRLPKLWSRLSTLETHTAKRKHSEKFKFDIYVAKFLLAAYDLNIPEDDILDMLGILQVYGVVNNYSSMVVYDKASLLEHNCLPNTIRRIYPDNTIIFWACRDIPKGQHISTCYTDIGLPTTKRFQQLLDTRYFHCTCVMCTDNTEMGSYYSALLCQDSDCRGPVLPASLCDLTPDTPWNCSRCSFTTSNTDVQLLLETVEKDMIMVDTLDYSYLVMLLKKWKQTNKLHPNHYFLVMAERAVVKLLNKGGSNALKRLPHDMLNVKIECCRHLNNVFDLIVPGKLRQRGVMRHQLCRCLAEKAIRLLDETPKDPKLEKAIDSDLLMIEAEATLLEATDLITLAPYEMVENDEYEMVENDE